MQLYRIRSKTYERFDPFIRHLLISMNETTRCGRLARETEVLSCSVFTDDWSSFFIYKNCLVFPRSSRLNHLLTKSRGFGIHSSCRIGRGKGGLCGVKVTASTWTMSSLRIRFVTFLIVVCWKDVEGYWGRWEEGKL